jgi:hypothetical protein
MRPGLEAGRSLRTTHPYEYEKPVKADNFV